MKTRLGFVSNSSSSSFVCIGVKVDNDTFEKLGGYEFFEDKFDYVDYVEGADYTIVGTRLARWSEGEGSVNARTFAEIEKEAVKIRKVVAKVFPDTEPNVELLFGEIYG